ncbi:hypothetical protein EDD16DRAFT_1541774, partial [Pisolithus croceorrhizus]
MDDDLDFGTSVWGASTDPPRFLMISMTFIRHPQTQNPSIAQDDDFGDFGDFGEPGPSDTTFVFEEDVNFRGRKDLRRQVEDILGSEWAKDLAEVEGIGQILAEPARFTVVNCMTCWSIHLPPTEPINWVRSRIRQQHLIALGLPPLPPLHVSIRPMSAPPAPPNEPPNPPYEWESQPVKQLGLGPKPQLDGRRLDELLDLDPEGLNLLPLAKLEKYLAELRSETTNTSSLLTYLLQTRDALQQDSETYNKLIAGLVSEAQKSKVGKKAGRRSGTLS